MEVVPVVSQLGKALWNLKVMYDQHVENENEIKELQRFIQDYEHQIPILREQFQEGGGNVIGIAAFKNLEKDLMGATNKLQRWLRKKSFFRVFNSTERMQKLEKLHFKVIASVQKSLGIANLSMLLDLQATQATILESNAELKSLLITTIGNMHGMLPTKVRDEVVEASTSSFGDPKFWEDVLVAVDNHNVGLLVEDKNMYEDPITTNLMIDPIVASDGNTYCRWTIIDNNLTTNSFNKDEDLTIVIDNLTFRRGLFEKFPEQAQIFQQRRKQYRSHALSLKAKGLWGDAALALHYVLQWDKCDVECVKALEQVQGVLQESKEKYLQPSMELSNEMKSRTWGSRRARNLELARSQVLALLELTGLREDKHESSMDLDWELDSSDKMIGELPQKFPFKDMARVDIYNFAIVLLTILNIVLIVCVCHVKTDTMVNDKNNITKSSSSQVDSFELEHNVVSHGQSVGGSKSSSTREIYRTIDVSIEHKERSIEGIQDRSKGILKLKQQRMSGKASNMSDFVQESMSNEKKEKRGISVPMKFYGSKLKHGLPELKALHRFSSSDIRRMTNNFSKENIIYEQGSYTDEMLKQSLQTGTLIRHGLKQIHKGIQTGTGATVAVHRLQLDLEGAFEAFKMEVEWVSWLQHKCVLSLVGYCLEHEPILIYEYPNNGSLYDHLHGTPAGSTLNWRMRLHIALTAAQGLEYLHTGCSRSVIHRNVSSKNILLTLEFNAKVADFELAKLMSETEDTRVMASDVEGTIGYLDPEYYRTCYVSTKSDVYSFGVVLLELITGRLPFNPSIPTLEQESHIVHLVLKRLRDNNIDSILAPIVKASNPNIEGVWKVINIAMRSLEPRAVHRPTMAQVVQELQGALTIEVGPIAKSPQFFFKDLTSLQGIMKRAS